jgi:putative Mn2+ efflux pump MntP
MPWCGSRVSVGKTIGMPARRIGPRRRAFVIARPERRYMNFAATAALALAMSADAFAAAISKGAALQRPQIKEALRTGLIFGVIEGITPVVGWALGLMAASYVEAWDHWIAFALLGILGLKMIHEGLAAPEVEREKPESHSFWLLAITGFATSIDAMAVGVGLAFLGADIAATAAAIGFSTFVMVTLGVMLGRGLGAIAGKRAELVGGVVLIAIGCLILYEHIGKAA